MNPAPIANGSNLTVCASKPLLLLDVDGVILPFGAGNPQLLAHYGCEESAGLAPAARDRLRDLTRSFDLVWATMWMEHANADLASLLDLPPLDVIYFDSMEPKVHPKLPAIRGYVGDRRFAWIDDTLDDSCHEFARSHDAGALMVATDPVVGLTTDHVDTLLDFAEGAT